MTRKSYGQYCGVAKALDHVGDRWTLLIVRELLIGPRRYSRIRAALPGIATNLLADRLEMLLRDGLIAKNEDGYYSLTPAGLELEPVVHALVRWGGRWMGERGPQDMFSPQWLVVALRALVDAPPQGGIELRVGGSVMHIDADGVDIGGFDEPDAVVEDEPERILAVAAGRAPHTSLSVRGDRRAVARVFRPT